MRTFESADIPPLVAWDYVVFSLVLVISAGIGLYYGCTGGRQKTLNEFLMGNRAMSMLPVTLSLMSSFTSSVGFLGGPSEIFKNGTQWTTYITAYFIVMPIVNYIYLPIYFKLKLTTVFEYLELRFNRFTRMLAVLVYTVQMLLYMGAVLYGPALALNAVTGIDLWLVIVLAGAVATFYTTLGGIKATLWTDSFQVCIIFAGIIAVLVKGSIDHGSFKNAWDISDKAGRVEFLNLSPDPRVRHTFWATIISGTFHFTGLYGVNQANVQRALTVPTITRLRWCNWINAPLLACVHILYVLCAIVMYAEYQHCDPVKSGRIKRADQVLPLYVMDCLSEHTGLAGLFIGSLFSACLSTLSSGFNALGAILIKDYIQLNFIKDISDRNATILTKCLVVFFGGAVIGLAFIISNFGDILQAVLSMFGILAGPQIGLFTLGILYPFANGLGGAVGFIVGLSLNLWVGLGRIIYKPPLHPLSKPKPVSLIGCAFLNMSTSSLDMTSPVNMMTSSVFDITTTAASVPLAASQKAGYLAFYEMSYLWYAPLGCFSTCVVGIIVSLLTGRKKPGEVNTRLTYPLLSNIFCCLPGSVRRVLRCYVDYSKEDNAPLTAKEKEEYEKSQAKQNEVFDNNLGKSDAEFGKNTGISNDTFEKPFESAKF